MTPEEALATARAVAAAAGREPDERHLAGALEQALPEWDRSRCRGTAREALLLLRLLSPPGQAGPGGAEPGRRVVGGLPEIAATTPLAAVLGLCLARPTANPMWADFRRLADLLRELEIEQRGQRRRARFPGPAGRRAAAEARGTRAVMSRAVAGFAATWGPGHDGRAATPEPGSRDEPVPGR